MNHDILVPIAASIKTDFDQNQDASILESGQNLKWMEKRTYLIFWTYSRYNSARMVFMLFSR